MTVKRIYEFESTISFAADFKEVISSPTEKYIINENIKDDDYSKYRVLIVGDDLISSQILELALIKKKLSVEVAKNSISAVDLFEKNSFDLVFMDVNLPDISGYEVTQKIKAISEEKNVFIPIIAVITNVLSGDYEKYLEAGMDDYISKPLQFSILYKKLNKFLKQKKNDLISIPTVNLMNGYETKEFSECLALLKTETGFELEECKELLNEFSIYADVLMVELFNAVEAHFYETSKRLLHKLKGSSGNIRAEKIVKLTKLGEKKLNDDNWSDLYLLLNEIKNFLIKLR
jgi:CheY-like chemotaxis protein